MEAPYSPPISHRPSSHQLRIKSRPDVFLLASLLLLAARPAQDPRLVPETTAEVLRVIDGDTLDILLDGQTESLRLLAVDTEEKISGHASGSATKPQTVFGQETALWARDLFASLPQPARVGLVFPGGRRRDVFDRLLAHVILPDGRHFNRLLVELGKSPYFNKYGNDPIAHEAFVRAQAGARAARRGIWDPATNRARTPGAPSAVRPYERLLPWWEARAQAIEGFRERKRAAPEALFEDEDVDGWRRAFELETTAPDRRLTLFGTIDRFYEERDGSLTVLLQGGDARSSLRVAVPAGARAEVEPGLRASTREFQQNYLYVTGRPERNGRGFLLTEVGPRDWVPAEPRSPAGSR